jgi:N-acetylmuramoyl-L-alanine amidase
MAEHTVKQGDCISSIAERHGLFWDKVWNHPKNANLQEKRKDPNVLSPGDVVFVPDKEEREASGATEQRHRFKKKGVPAKLRLRIREEPEREESREAPPETASATDSGDSHTEEQEGNQTQRQDEPRRNVPYVLNIDGNLIEGTTDEEGMIEINIPPNAQRGRLIVEPGTPNEISIPVNLGHLNPISELSGIKQRLANLGFDCGDRNEEETPGLEAMLRAFQEKHGLNVTGELDQTTRDKIQELHGS